MNGSKTQKNVEVATSSLTIGAMISLAGVSIYALILAAA